MTMLANRTIHSICAAGVTSALVLLGACQQTRTAQPVATPASDATPAPPLADEDRVLVESFLAQADADYEAGRWAKAADGYTAVLELEPRNLRAEEGLTSALTRLDVAHRIDDVLWTHELRQTATLAEFDAGYQRSLQALESEQFELAKGSILQARMTLHEGRDYIAPDDFESRDAKAAELLDAIDRVWELHVRSGG
jgi:hypothetical protein